MEKTEAKRFLSPREVAAEYGGTPALWRKLIHQRRLKGYRVGDVNIVIQRKDVERFIMSAPVDGPTPVRRPGTKGGRVGRPPKQRAKRA